MPVGAVVEAKAAHRRRTGRERDAVAEHHGPVGRHVADPLGEQALDVVHRRIPGVVVEVDVRHHRDPGAQQRAAAVRLVALRDQQVSPARPGVPAQLRHLAAHEPGRVEPEPVGREGDHGGGGRLPVRPRDADRRLQRNQLGEQLSTVDDAKPKLRCSGQLVELVGHRR